MAYIDTATVKEIRNEIKARFPAYKFSVTREHYYTVLVKILSGPVAFDLGREDKYAQLNVYHLDKIQDANLSKLAQEIQQIILSKKAQEFHETGDYGSQPNFYISIHVGAWDKPYQVTVDKKAS